MNLSLFNYNLPRELIAQTPAEPRDTSGLLVYERKTGALHHDKFFNLSKYLRADDVLVFNNTKVFPARLIMRKLTGGKIEIFLLKKIKSCFWECLIGGKIKDVRKLEITCLPARQGKQKTGTRLVGEIIKKIDESRWLIKFNLKEKKFFDFIDKYGEVPVPPYITKFARHSLGEGELRQKYQTVYAKYFGSVAAPTAGFHFTKKLLAQIKKMGIAEEFVTLHVGLGTFAPVKTEQIETHKMHAEVAQINKKTCDFLNAAKKEGRRIIAVGTTTARTLEAAVDKNCKLKPINKKVNIFIYPGYKFKFVDALMTNFHLPTSTLLMLVAAFLGQKKNKSAGIKIMQKIYAVAIKKKYRFYSFGDGMMIE
jgi:S-adenosylmethionine:tRNA ribosyltransferase-isomerase